MSIRELETSGERRAAVPILQELWTDRDPETVLAWTESDEYHLFGRFDGEVLVGVAGVRIDEFLHHARHAWLYDLVVTESRRGEGHASALLEFVESWARERECAHIALASPLAKRGVHEFYDRRGYEPWGYVLEREL
ncbi:GNAT family N-acetyltransferase [Natronobiforma cellulositropha]|uniref:GNAT family N-acetyltransferase n=1 Tax=Natronobiforma cellulositropha TaxID=1679076 RepID=UPI0021D59C24|nr:GNAT family N-acetyltransferase [Natronobiforma cellulositropha]